MSMLFETQGIESYFARNAEEFLKLVHEHNPHLAFVHIQQLDAIFALKRDPAFGGTPTVVVNSLGIWGAKAMSDAGLAGPTIDLPYNQAHLMAALECFGRSGDQPLPEPVPYLMGDPSLLDASSGPMDSTHRRFLIVADGFSLIYLTRALNGIGRIVYARSRRDAHAALALKDLDLLLVADPSGYAVSEFDRSARAVGVPMIALISGDRSGQANTDGEGPLLVGWPISKMRLVDFVEATLSGLSHGGRPYR
jgi:hypothetical protein